MKQPVTKSHSGHLEAADPVFTRLLQDIPLARAVKRRVRGGALDGEYFAKAEELQRRAFRHLAAYLSEKGGKQ
jgi:hypothetical protein